MLTISDIGQGQYAQTGNELYQSTAAKLREVECILLERFDKVYTDNEDRIGHTKASQSKPGLESLSESSGKAAGGASAAYDNSEAAWMVTRAEERITAQEKRLSKLWAQWEEQKVQLDELSARAPPLAGDGSSARANAALSQDGGPDTALPLPDLSKFKVDFSTFIAKIEKDMDANERVWLIAFCLLRYPYRTVGAWY